MGWSDEALMGNLRRGDMQAFDELYTRHRQPLFNFILRLLQDAALAEDVFQETYMRVLENADRFKPRNKFSTWLYTVAHNLCMDELRRQNTSIPAEQMAEPPVRDPQDHLLKREDEAAAHQLLAALQPPLARRRRPPRSARLLAGRDRENRRRTRRNRQKPLAPRPKTTAPNGTEPMNQDHRTIQEIQALLGSAPEVSVPPRLDEEVRSKAVSWAKKKRAEKERLHIPLYGKIALGLVALELFALLYAVSPRLDIDQIIRASVLGLVGLNIAALLTSPIILLHCQRRELSHE